MPALVNSSTVLWQSGHICQCLVTSWLHLVHSSCHFITYAVILENSYVGIYIMSIFRRIKTSFHISWSSYKFLFNYPSLSFAQVGAIPDCSAGSYLILQLFMFKALISWFWGRNKAPFPSQKSIYFPLFLRKISPSQKKNKINKQNWMFSA